MNKKRTSNDAVDSSQQHKLMRTSDIEEFLFANDDDEEKDELDKFCFVDENPDLTKLQASAGHETTAPQHDEEQVQVNHYYMEMPPAKSSSHGVAQGLNTYVQRDKLIFIGSLEMTDETYSCHFCERSFRLKKDLDAHLYFKPLYNSSPEYFICHHYKCGQKLKTEVSTLFNPITINY